MAGRFEIRKRKSGEFHFNLKAGNGQVILTSEGYTTKESCLGGIESTRNNSVIDAHFERRNARDGSPFFTLKAGNGQVIGGSEMYGSAAARDKGIASVQTNAPSATVRDATA